MNNPDPVHGLTAENFLKTVPVALQKDPSVAALADVTARLLAQRPEEIDQLRIYPRIMELDEKLLDILAYDFKVDWWDPNYTLDEKRRTLADSWRVHKILGTKAAVETAISAIFPGTKVEEWFEYEGGKPYYFRLHIPAAAKNVSLEKQNRVVSLVWFYKNLRSHIDAIEYVLEVEAPPLRTGGTFTMMMELPIPEEPDTYNFQGAVQAGGTFTPMLELSVPEEPDAWEFRGAAHIGGVFTPMLELPIPEEPDSLEFQSTVHINGGFNVITTLPVKEEGN